MAHQRTTTPTPPPEPFRVRPARTEDLPAVVALDAENTGVAKPAYWKDRFEWYAGRKPDRFFLVGEREGQVLGYIVGEVRAWEFGSPPAGWVFAIDVSQTARLNGLGTKLFEEICERFRKAGVDRVRTMLPKDERLTMSFFRSQGMMGGPFIQLEKELAP
jgi:ribosomal protein S18 acetylase RimI-like enzyme